MRPSIRFAEFVLVTALVAAIFVSWRADRRDRAQLATQLAAAQQTIAAATDRQKERDAQLTQTLVQLATERKSTITPEQILKKLPQALGLPAPLSIQPLAQPAPAEASTSPPSNQHDTLPNNPAPKYANDGDAILPSADLKPLYDFALDCQACRAKLAAAQNDLADEKTKSTSLAKERDDAIRTAKGGTALRRIARAAKWFLLGAAAGAIASKAVR